MNVTARQEQWAALGRAAVATLSALVLLSSCASMAPRYQRPTAPIPDVYPTDALATGADPLGHALSWRAVFVDPDLQRIIELSLQNSRDLRTATLRVEESRALRGIQRSDRFPNVGATIAGIRSGTPAEVSLTGQSGVTSIYLATAGASSWELDLWGRVRSLDVAAIENYLATDAARRAFTLSLVAQVADAWLTQRELDRRLALARQTIASREESLRIFRRREAVGSGSRLELAQVEALLTQAQALGAQLELARATNSHALALLAGTSVDLPPKPDAFESSPEPVRAVGAGLPSDLLGQRPDIIAAEHRLRAANANIGAARAAFFPRITLTGAHGSASTELDGLFGSDSRSWSFIPVISVPIFSGGRLRSNLDVAEIRRDLAVSGYELSIQKAFRDVADALAAHRWLSEQVTIQRNALRALSERARLAQARYESGASGYLEVLDAQRDLLSAEQGVVQSERAVLSSRVALFAALGGGAFGPETQ